MRNCGECTLCCLVTRVPEFNKPENTLCDRCIDSGCSIYSERPESCKGYTCAWLSGELPEELRPDKSHILIEKLPEVSVVLALIDPNFLKNWCTDSFSDLMRKTYVYRGISVVSTTGHAMMAEGVTPKELMRDVRKAANIMGVI